MAIIYSYPDALVTDLIRLVGSNTAITGNPTISLSVASLADFIISDFSTGTVGYLPYYDTASSLKASYISQNTSTLLVSVEENINIVKQLTAQGEVTLFSDLTGVSASFSEKVAISNGLTVGLPATPAGGVSFWAPTRVYGVFSVGEATTPIESTFYGDVILKEDLIDILSLPGTAAQVLSSRGNGLGTQWVDQVQSGLVYQGTWDALNNVPALASSVGTAGHYYIVETAGTTNLNGITDWQVGDWAIFASTSVWQKVDNTSILGGAGTVNTLPKWTGATTLGDSKITDDGASIIIDTTSITLKSTGAATSQTNLESDSTIAKTNFQFSSTLTDGSGGIGTAGQVLSSTVTGVAWADQAINLSVPEVSFTVYNGVGSTITKGSPVYLQGETTIGGIVYPVAYSTSDFASVIPSAVGLMKADLLTASLGSVLVTGMLEDIITNPINSIVTSVEDKIFMSDGVITPTRPVGVPGVALGKIQTVGTIVVLAATPIGKIWVDVKDQFENLPNVTSTKVLVGNASNKPVESSSIRVDDVSKQVVVGTDFTTTANADFVQFYGKSYFGKANWLQYGESNDALSADIRYTIQNSTLTTGLSYNLVNSDLGDFYISKGDPSTGAALVVEEKIASFTSNDSSTISSTQNLISFYDNNFTSGDDIADNPFASTANSSAAFGINHSVSGNYSMAVGQSNTIATTAYAFGTTNTVSGSLSMAVGKSNTISATAENSFASGSTNYLTGDYTFASGTSNSIDAAYSGAIGRDNTITSGGSYSFAVGRNHIIQGLYNFAAGLQNQTDSEYTILGGYSNTIGATSHSSALFGINNALSGTSSYSIAAGSNNIITGERSSTFGGNLTNANNYATVLGRNNLAQATGEIFTIGSGTSALNLGTAMSLIGTFGLANYELKVSGNIWGTGGIKDSDGQLGTAGQVLSTTGTLTNWIDAATGGTLNGLTDCLVTANSIFLGNDPIATWNNALYNVSVGIASLSVITTGDNNTVIGYDAGRSITEGSSNVLIGKEAGELITTASTNVMIGNGAGKAITDGLGNIVLGSNSADSTAGDIQNHIVIGNFAGRVLDTFKHNICIGNSSGAVLTTGGWNTLVGYNAGNKLTTGGDNTLIGSEAGEDLTGSDNTLVGRLAGNKMTTGTGSVLIGNEAGELLTNGSQNVAIGSNALESANAGSYNVAIGSNSLNDQNLGTPGQAVYNTSVGYSSGSALTSGTQNVILGALAGTTITTGSNNTLIGHNAEPDGGVGSNQIIIGHGVIGHGDNIIVIGNTSNTAIHPEGDNAIDLGSVSYSFKDAYIQGTSNAGGFKVDAMQAVPASASATGIIGDIRFTADYIFVCVATDTWKRSALTTW